MHALHLPHFHVHLHVSLPLQESCQPGIPANGADPRRLLPLHPQLSGVPSGPGTNYAGSEAGGSYAQGPSAGTSTGGGLSGSLPAVMVAPSGSSAAAVGAEPGSNASVQVGCSVLFACSTPGM
jgi:hypothetical protein